MYFDSMEYLYVCASLYAMHIYQTWYHIFGVSDVDVDDVVRQSARSVEQKFGNNLSRSIAVYFIDT